MFFGAGYLIRPLFLKMILKATKGHRFLIYSVSFGFFIIYKILFDIFKGLVRALLRKYTIPVITINPKPVIVSIITGMI